MGRDKPERPVFEPKLKDQRAARFNPGEVQVVAILDPNVGRQQNRVAVPADRRLVPAGIGDVHPGFGFDQAFLQGRRPMPQPSVGFLQGDNVGVQGVDDTRRPVRITAPVEAHAFPDVPGGEAQLRQGGSSAFGSKEPYF